MCHHGFSSFSSYRGNILQLYLAFVNWVNSDDIAGLEDNSLGLIMASRDKLRVKHGLATADPNDLVDEATTLLENRKLKRM